MTTVSVQKRLLLRQLNPDTDAPALRGMDFGDEYWEREVRHFAHETAIPYEIKGNASTTLGFHVETKELIVLMATGTKFLEVDEEFRRIFEISNRRLPMSPVEAGFIKALGVDRRHQNQGYAHEIYESYLESLREGFQRPRFVYLEVYERSPAVRLYEEKWRFRRIGFVPEKEGAPDRRLRMALDRYQRPKEKS